MGAATSPPPRGWHLVTRKSRSQDTVRCVLGLVTCAARRERSRNTSLGGDAARAGVASIGWPIAGRGNQHSRQALVRRPLEGASVSRVAILKNVPCTAYTGAGGFANGQKQSRERRYRGLKTETAVAKQVELARARRYIGNHSSAPLCGKKRAMLSRCRMRFRVCSSMTSEAHRCRIPAQLLPSVYIGVVRAELDPELERQHL